MKYTIIAALIAIALLGSSHFAKAQGMAVNNTGAAANSSAMLDVSSTNQGMLAPRMTSAQRTAISSPATGLLVYQTDGTAGFYYFNGSAWTLFSATGSGATPGGIPYTCANHSTTTIGSIMFSLIGTISIGVGSALTTHTSMVFSNCHPSLTAYAAGTTTFPLTVNLVNISFSTSSNAVTPGTTIGSCIIPAAGGTCSVDVAGSTVFAGQGVAVTASNTGTIILNTAFSCQ